MGLSSSRLEEMTMQSRLSNAGNNGEAATPGVPPPTGAAASGPEKKQGSSSSPSSSTTTTKFDEIVVSSGDQKQAFKVKKYWVDEGTKANCFMLFPRGFSITWGSDTRYWSWRNLTPEERSGVHPEEADIEVAYLKDVCWLEIRARLEMSHLSPGVTYDVVFLAKLDPSGYGWSEPVDLQLKCPNDGKPRQRKESLWKKLDGKDWTELKVGEVQAEAGQKGEMEIAMLRLGGDWKRGLILRGIKITPK